MNVIMESGKKAVAERIIYGALEQVEKKAGKESLEVFPDRPEQRQAAGRSEVPPRRRCELPVPVEVRPVRRMVWPCAG